MEIMENKWFFGLLFLVLVSAVLMFAGGFFQSKLPSEIPSPAEEETGLPTPIPTVDASKTVVVEPDSLKIPIDSKNELAYSHEITFEGGKRLETLKFLSTADSSVTVLSIIPKSVASSASKLIEDSELEGATVLQEDPVIYVPVSLKREVFSKVSLSIPTVESIGIIHVVLKDSMEYSERDLLDISSLISSKKSMLRLTVEDARMVQKTASAILNDGSLIFEERLQMLTDFLEDFDRGAFEGIVFRYSKEVPAAVNYVFFAGGKNASENYP
ncbi:MAG: hypothetical protein V1717_00975, partial [Candidatus Micrarchaeota archaeon]